MNGVPDDEQDQEPDEAGDHDGVPADLVELHEVQEWERAVVAGGGQPS